MGTNTLQISTSTGESFAAYVASPTGTPAPALVILHEIFGITPAMRAAAECFAAHGFLAVVPDLFWRQGRGIELSDTDEEHRKRGYGLMQNMKETETLADIQATADQLRRSSECSGRVGAVGYCLGGRLAFLSACDGAIDVAVGYYATAVHTVLDQATRLKRPVLLHIAKDDNLCVPEAQSQIQQRLGTNLYVDLRSHGGVGHAFARAGSPAYNPATAAIADLASVQFLTAHLRAQ